MFESISLRAPSDAPFCPTMAETVSALRLGPVAPFRQSRFYTYVGDLRKSHKIDAILHLEYKYGECTHKLEIVDAGKKSLDEMEKVVASVFELDPKKLELMRADFSADISGVPVSWFRESARFQYKRFASQIDKANAKSELEFIGMGTAVSQSLYAGRRPNCVRIYNKFEELRQQWLKFKRSCDRFNRQLVDFELSEDERKAALRIPPTFEQFCLNEGFQYTEGATLTRIERQIGGERFPEGMRTFGDLYRSDEFDPFNGLQLLPSSPVNCLQPPSSGVSIRWLATLGFQGVVTQLGSAQTAHSWLMKHSNGNGKRIIESVVCPIPEERAPVTKAEILRIYQASTKKQIEGKSNSGLYLPPNYEQTETSGRSTELLPQTGPDRWQSTSGKTDAGAA